MVTRKRILVVEDNQINRIMLCGILSPTYEIFEAENGEEALALLRLYSTTVSLILLDLIMPVMDGYTFLSKLKDNPTLSPIPVIVTTQSDSEADEVTALSHGAADFVAKPYKPQVILHRVANIINLRESAAMINQFQYDPLTGLFSKAFFYQRARELLALNPTKKYDLICSDIENFKLVNDIYGVPTGDRLLRSLGEMYAKRVGDKGICAHFNADQFACLLERGCAYNDKQFIDIAIEINASANTKNVVLKWGIYHIENRSLPIEQMCDRSLLAARSIKNQYGRYFATYDDTLRNRLVREQSITNSMETALAQQQFCVYLQPKYCLKDNRLEGAEALVRWNHPKFGFLSPGEFIPLFEKNGFISKLDRFVWDKCCATVRGWLDAGLPTTPLSVNVSRADVYQADVVDVLLNILAKYDLPPTSLHLEITESAYTENPEQLITMVSHLRRLGFIIEMDDFGSGYSSLNMLNRMPLDILKLDMQFIRSETAKPNDQGILHFIMSLARWMNLKVVAEGVETAEQVARLKEIGCDYVQGYYFARPMPINDFEALLKQDCSAAPPL